MDWHYIGLGVSACSMFGRYRFPAIPKPIASAAITLGFGVVSFGILSQIRFGPSVLGIVGIMLLVAAVDWQFSSTERTGITPIAALPSPLSPASTLQKQMIPKTNDAAIYTTPEPIEKTRRLPPKVKQIVVEKRDVKSTILIDNNSGPSNTTTAIVLPTAQDRFRILTQITQLYILDHDGISSRMLAGLELPPAEFINTELERQGMKWRVSSIDGPNAKIYEDP